MKNTFLSSKNYELINIVEKNCSFYQHLNKNNKKKFIKKVFQFLKNLKFSLNEEIFWEEKILIASALAQITFSFKNYTLSYFKNFKITSNIEEFDEELQISKAINEKSFYFYLNPNEKLKYDILFNQTLKAFYIDYLYSDYSFRHLDNYIYDVEIMIESLLSKEPLAPESAIVRFANIVEQFFVDPENFKHKFPQLFQKLSFLFLLDTSNYTENFAISKTIKKIIKENKYDISRTSAFFINYSTLSFFIGSFLLFFTLSKTLINLFFVLIYIIVISFFSFILFMPNLKILKKLRLNIFPYIFFCIFGVGVNSLSILLTANLLISINKENTKLYAFAPNEINLISDKILLDKKTKKPKTVERIVKLNFQNFNLSKRITFSIPIYQIPVNYYVVEIDKGILGFYVIKKKYTY